MKEANLIDLQSDVFVTRVDNGKVDLVKGRLIGRTIEESPRYDVLFPDRSVAVNIPASQVSLSRPRVRQ